jgi:phage protein U
MSDDTSRPVPLLGDISLELVQRIQHSLDSGFVPTRIAGLSGELQQRSGRPSHHIHIAGVLFGEEAADELATLQKAAESGEELTFAANITTALDLQQVVITSFQATEVAGKPDQFNYELALVESPPLPPPAQIEPFGGLGDFGLGDLGFDTDILGDLLDAAGDIAGAIDGALDLIDQLGALADLVDMGGLELGGFLQPMEDAAGAVSDIASSFGDATQSFIEAFSE